MTVSQRLACVGIMVLCSSAVFAQFPTPQQGITRQFVGLNQKLIQAVKDFPEDKFDYRPGEGIRSFREVALHIMQGNIWAAKVVKDSTAQWADDDYSLKTKAQVVAAFEKTASEASEALKAQPAEAFSKTLAPWLAVLEHNAEHYGQLVQYYRSNKLVPPASRK